MGRIFGTLMSNKEKERTKERKKERKKREMKVVEKERKRMR